MTIGEVEKEKFNVWDSVLLWFVLGLLVVLFKMSAEDNRWKPRTSNPRKVVPRPTTKDYIFSLFSPPWVWSTMGTMTYGASPAPDHQQDPPESNIGRIYPRIPRLSGLIRVQNLTAETIVEDWRKAITGLIGLANGNLETAKTQLKLGNHTGAVQAALTSIENISRALIHCYGGKPDQGPGQEEPLRMLSQRFKGDEKEWFEKAIDDIEYVHSNVVISKHLSGSIAQCLGRVRVDKILETSSEATGLIRRIIMNHFGEELANRASESSSAYA